MSDTPTITPSRNGPFIVTNCRLLKSLSDATVHPSDGTVALCRCGGSKNKPFCDGTHKTNGFTGDRSPDRPPDRRDSYEGATVTIHDNRGICAHAGACTDGLETVFKLRQEPWIDPDGDTAARIIETVKQCPSGALSYSVGGVEHRDHGGEPMILIAPNGPYLVKGGATLKGVELGEGASNDHFTLCRCGRSTNKPFCSGAHWDHPFDEQAPKPRA